MIYISTCHILFPAEAAGADAHRLAAGLAVAAGAVAQPIRRHRREPNGRGMNGGGRFIYNFALRRRFTKWGWHE